MCMSIYVCNMTTPCSTPSTSVTMEELVEQDKVFEVWVRIIARIIAMTWATPFIVRQKETGDSSAEVMADLKQVHPVTRTSRIFHLEVISIVEVVSLQALNDKEIY